MHHEPTSASCISSACPTGKKTVATCYLRVLRRHRWWDIFSTVHPVLKSLTLPTKYEITWSASCKCAFIFFSPPAAIFSLTALSHLPRSEEKKKRKREREKLVHRLVSIFTDRTAFFFLPPQRLQTPIYSCFFFSSRVPKPSSTHLCRRPDSGCSPRGWSTRI